MARNRHFSHAPTWSERWARLYNAIDSAHRSRSAVEARTIEPLLPLYYIAMGTVDVTLVLLMFFRRLGRLLARGLDNCYCFGTVVCPILRVTLRHGPTVLMCWRPPSSERSLRGATTRSRQALCHHSAVEELLWRLKRPGYIVQKQADNCATSWINLNRLMHHGYAAKSYGSCSFVKIPEAPTRIGPGPSATHWPWLCARCVHFPVTFVMTICAFAPSCADHLYMMTICAFAPSCADHLCTLGMRLVPPIGGLVAGAALLLLCDLACAMYRTAALILDQIHEPLLEEEPPAPHDGCKVYRDLLKFPVQ